MLGCLFLLTQENKGGPPFNLFCITCSFQLTNSGNVIKDTLYVIKWSVDGPTTM